MKTSIRKRVGALVLWLSLLVAPPRSPIMPSTASKLPRQARRRRAPRVSDSLNFALTECAEGEMTESWRDRIIGRPLGGQNHWDGGGVAGGQPG